MNKEIMNMKKLNLFVAVIAALLFAAPSFAELTEGIDYEIDDDCVYLAKTGAGLQEMRSVSAPARCSESNLSFALGNDIVLSEEEQNSSCTENWPAIVSLENMTFDGRNFTISGVCVKTVKTWQSLFSVNASVVQNLKLKNIYVESLGMSATISLFGRGTVQFENVDIQDVNIVAGGGYTDASVGLLQGASTKPNVNNVNARNINITLKANEARSLVGGFFGSVTGSSTSNRISNSSFDGSIKASCSKSLFVGGVIGSYDKTNLRYLQFKNNDVRASIDAAKTGNGYTDTLAVGGFVGYMDVETDSTYHYYRSSSFTGSIVADARSYVNIGGAFGFVGPYSTSNAAAFSGLTISSPDEKALITIKNTPYSASYRRTVGGLIGKTLHNMTLNNVAVEGDIVFDSPNYYDFVSGLVAYNMRTLKMYDSRFIGSITLPTTTYYFGELVYSDGSASASVYRSYAVDSLGPFANVVKGPVGTVGKNASGKRLSEPLTIKVDKTEVGFANLQSPEFARLMEMGYDPNLKRAVALGAGEKHPYAVIGMARGDTIYAYYTGPDGKIAYNADGSLVSSVISDYPAQWPDAWKVSKTQVFSGDVFHELGLQSDEYEEDNCIFTLKTKNALKSFKEIDKGSCYEYSYKLGADFDFGAANDRTCQTNWDGLGMEFDGDLDGAGHTLSGICYKSTYSDHVYLFNMNGYGVKNLNITNSYIQKKYASSSEYANRTSLFENVGSKNFLNLYISDVSVVDSSASYNHYTGLLEALVDEDVFVNNVRTHEVSIWSNSGTVGGFFGKTLGNVDIQNSAFHGTVYSGTSCNYANLYAGGFVGESTDGSFTAENSSFSGQVSAIGWGNDRSYEAASGGIVGRIGSEDAYHENNLILQNVTVSSTIGRNGTVVTVASPGKGYVAGFAGRSFNNVQIKDGSNVLGNIDIASSNAIAPTKIAFFVADLGEETSFAMENSYFVGSFISNNFTNVLGYAPKINTASNSYAVWYNIFSGTFSNLQGSNRVAAGDSNAAMLYDGKMAVEAYAPNTPKFANVLQNYSFNPELNSGHPVYERNREKRTYELKVLLKEDSTLLYSLYTNSSGKLTYDGEGELFDSKGMPKTVLSYLDKTLSKNEEVYVSLSDFPKIVTEDYEIQGNVVLLKTPSALMNIASIPVSANIAVNVYKFASDMDLGASNNSTCKNNWDPSNAKFSGILDGDGHTLSGVCYKVTTTQSDSAGVFRLTGSSTIKNLNFKNIYVKDSMTVSTNSEISLFKISCDAVCEISYKDLSLENIAVTLDGHRGDAGLLFGNSLNASVININDVNAKDVSLTLETSLENDNYGDLYGGLLGATSGEMHVSNVHIEGSVIERSSQSSIHIGGAVGRILNSTNASTFTDVSFKGSLLVHRSASTSEGYGYLYSGVVGRSDAYIILKNVSANAVVDAFEASSTYMGGIVGYSSQGISVDSCTFVGSITSNSTEISYRNVYIGGILGSGYSYSGNSNIKNVKVTNSQGDSSKPIIKASSFPDFSSSYYIGGVIGSTNNLILENATASGTISAIAGKSSGSIYIGGLAGLLSSTKSTIKKSKYSGKITVDASLQSINPYIGGLAGRSSGDFIGNTIQGTEQNDGSFVLLDVSSQENTYVGGLTGECDVTGSDNVHDNSIVGDIVIKSSSENRYADFWIAGFIGHYGGTVANFENNTYQGSLDIQAEGVGYTDIAGFVGGSNGNILIGKSNNALASKNGKLINLKTDDATIKVGGFVGRANTGVDVKKGSLVQGNISVSVTGTKARPYIGGMIGYWEGGVDIESSIFQGTISYSSTETSENSTKIGGLVGAKDYESASSDIRVFDSEVKGPNGTNSDNIIVAGQKGSQPLYAGGVVGYLNGLTNIDIARTRVNGGIKASSGVAASFSPSLLIQRAPTPVTGNIVASGIIGKSETSEESGGTIKDSYYVGSLAANSTDGSVYGLLNDGVGNVLVESSYAIDFSGAAEKAVNTDKTEYVGFGSSLSDEATVEYNGIAIGKAKANSPQFAMLMRSYMYNPDENDGYPVLGSGKYVMWMEDESIKYFVQIFNGKGILPNGAVVNERNAVTLPQTRKYIEDGKLKVDFWTNEKDGTRVGDDLIFWLSEDYGDFFENLSETVVLYPKTLEITIPQFYQEDGESFVQNNPDDMFFWNGDNFDFATAQKLPKVVFLKESEVGEVLFLSPLNWNFSLHNGDNIDFRSVALYEIKDFWENLIYQVSTTDLDKDGLEAKLSMPLGGDADNYVSRTTFLNYGNMKEQNLVVTIDSLDQDIIVPLDNSASVQSVAIPQASKIKFSNDSKFIMETYGYKGNLDGDTVVCAADTTIIFDNGWNPQFSRISVYKEAVKPIVVDTSVLASLGTVYREFDIPTTYKPYGQTEIRFPELATTEDCFEGWLVSFELDGDRESIMVSASENFTFEIPMGSSIENIKAEPTFLNDMCNGRVMLAYTESAEDFTVVDGTPVNLDWTVSFKNSSALVSREDERMYVDLPKTTRIKFNLSASANKDLVFLDLNHKPIEKDQMLVDANTDIVFAITADNFVKSTPTVVWKDHHGNTFDELYFIGGGWDLYRLVDQDGVKVPVKIVSTDPNSPAMPKLYYVENNKFYVFRSEKGWWNNNRLLEKNEQFNAEVITLEKAIQFYVVEDGVALPLESALSEWGNFYVEDFDPFADENLPKLAGQYISETGDNRFYESDVWTFAHATSASSVATMDSLVGALFAIQDENDIEERLGKEGGISLFKVVSGNEYFDDNENTLISGCLDIEWNRCQLSLFNTVVKSGTSESVEFDGVVYGKTYGFNVSGYMNLPALESISFSNAEQDSMIVVQTDENGNQLGMDVVAANSVYKLPSNSLELNLALRIMARNDALHAVNVELPAADGTIFRSFALPTSFYDGVDLELPQLATLSSCDFEYKIEPDGNNPDEFIDLWKNDNGGYTWSTGLMNRDVSIRAVISNTNCVVPAPYIVSIEADSATVSLSHFGEILAPAVENGRPVYRFPANGKWPAFISVIPNEFNTLEELQFNGEIVENESEIIVSGNSFVTVITAVSEEPEDPEEPDDPDFPDDPNAPDVYHIADAKVITSGKAVRFVIKTADIDAREPVFLKVIMTYNDELVIDSILTMDAKDSTYIFDRYPLAAGSYRIEAILNGRSGDVRQFAEWTVEENKTIVRAGTWYIASLADVSDEFKLPDSDHGAVYYWDEGNAIGDFMQYRKLGSVKDVDPTAGYWFINRDSVNIPREVKDSVVSENLIWNLKNEFTGWNMVANPYSWTLNLGEFNFEDPEDPSVGFWHWDAATMGYVVVDSVEAYEGLWVHTNEPREIVLSTVPKFNMDDHESKDMHFAQKASAKDSWSLRLVLSGENGVADAWNVVGVGSREIEVDEPPAPMEGGVSLSISNGGKALAKSIKRSSKEYAWNLNLDASTPQRGRLSVRNLEKLEAAGLYAALVLDDKVVPLTAGEDVSLDLSTVSARAVLKVSANPAVQLALGVRDLRFKARGNSLDVSFVLGEDCSDQVQVRLLDTRGKVVGRAAEEGFAGQHSIAVDKPATAGVYILRVTAGKDAQQIKIKL